MMLDLRQIRCARAIKQKDLAEKCNLSLHELMKIERGLRPPNDLELIKISSILNLTEEELRKLKQSDHAPTSGEGYVTAKPTKYGMIRRSKSVHNGKKPIIDLFCGVGGFSSGFEQIEEYQVVAGIDLLNDRLNTFRKNHKAANAYGFDIRKINSKKLLEDNPEPFAIVAGPPCQGFSSIRPFRNIEWNDPRNNLGEEFLRIVTDLQPEWVIFENVIGLLTYKKGKVISAICDALSAAGYRTEKKILNTANYGVPQRRERLIIVGSRKGKIFKWPSPTHSLESRSMAGKSNLLITSDRQTSANLRPAVTLIDAIGDLPELKSGESVTEYSSEPNTTYQKFIRNNATKLSLHTATKHSKKMLKIIQHSGANINSLPEGLVKSGFSSCYSRLEPEMPSVTITVNFTHPASNRCIHPYQNRALTPREGARIQGFFDTFSFEGTRAQIVKQIGNAVPPILGKKIAEAILESD